MVNDDNNYSFIQMGGNWTLQSFSKIDCLMEWWLNTFNQN